MLVLVAILLSVAGIPLLPFLALGEALLRFFASAGVRLDGGDVVVLFAALLAAPLGALFAGALIGRFALPGERRTFFARVGALVALALGFETTTFPEYLEAVTALLVTDSTPASALAVASAAGHALFAGALVGLAAVLVDLAAEAPARWVLEGMKAELDLPLDALRPLLVIVALTLLFNLALGLFAFELAPTRLFLGAR